MWSGIAHTIYRDFSLGFGSQNLSQPCLMSFFMSGESSKSAWRIGEWGHFPGDFFRSLANEKNLKIGYVTWALRGYLDRRALRGSCFHLPFLAILKFSCSIIVAQPFHFGIWILTFLFFGCGTLILKPLNRNMRKAVQNIKVPGGGGVEWGHGNTRIYSIVFTTVSICVYIYIFISLYSFGYLYLYLYVYIHAFIYIYIYSICISPEEPTCASEWITSLNRSCSDCPQVMVWSSTKPAAPQTAIKECNNWGCVLALVAPRYWKALQLVQSEGNVKSKSFIFLKIHLTQVVFV